MLQYIESGFALVPIPLMHKGPKITGWNKLEKVVKSFESLGCLEGMNIGLAHAYCQPSPTCALDIDFYPDAKNWLELNGLNLNDLINDLNVVGIISGKKYSLKLLYRLPLGVKPIPTKVIKNDKGKTILEFRCATKDGLTVQDVLPPSIHPSGGAYQWVGNGQFTEMPEIPANLLHIWLNPPQKERLSANQINRTNKFVLQHLLDTPETPKNVARVKSLLQHIDSNCDYITWRNVVWGILSTGWKNAIFLAQIWSMTSRKKYSEKSFLKVVEKFNCDRGITLGTVYFHAKQGGWSV
jgi:hypothetical protein